MNSSANRDLATDDDIFLETVETIDAAVCSGIDKNASRILEGSGREEGVGPDRDFRNTK